MDASSHRLRAIYIAVVALSGLCCGPVQAQKSPLGNQDNGGLNGSLSRSDLEKLSGDRKSNEPRDPVLARAKATEQGAKLVGALQLSCDITDAQQVVAGTRRLGGKEVPVRVYEVACSQGMGYLLETQGAAQPVGISCLTAEEARAADVAKGKEPGFFCNLPENKDVYALVTSLIAAGTGAQCTVQQVQLFGRSQSTQTEYSEVVCKEGKGYLLRTALPGSQAKTTVTSCAEAARQGIKCRLTDSGPVETPVTLDTLKGALAEHGVSCRIDPIRLIGQEDHLKRYVVEYRCADQPAGGVAFVPLQGNENPYETLDCAAAALRGLACLYAPAEH